MLKHSFQWNFPQVDMWAFYHYLSTMGFPAHVERLIMLNIFTELDICIGCWQVTPPASTVNLTALDQRWVIPCTLQWTNQRYLKTMLSMFSFPEKGHIDISVYDTEALVLFKPHRLWCNKLFPPVPYWHSLETYNTSPCRWWTVPCQWEKTQKGKLLYHSIIEM